jgi:RHS repeat-associated protein
LNGASPGTPANPLPDLLTALISGIGALPGGGHPSPAMLTANQTPISTNFSQFLQDTGAAIVQTKPHAFLNWVLFDNQFNYVAASSGFEQVGADQEPKKHILTNLPVSESGYLYIYTSNETPNVDVFFDNLQVTHTRGPLLEEDHYYPFGLIMDGISDKALKSQYIYNKYRFNEGSELQNKEFADGSGLESYDFGARTYDPQLGKFLQIDQLPELAYNYSPYAYANGNPILINDPTGLISDSANPQELQPAIVTAKRPLDTKNGQVYPSRSAFWDAWSGHRVWRGYQRMGNRFYKVDYEVDSRGYLTGALAPNLFAAEFTVSETPLSLKDLKILKNFIQGRYVIYRSIRSMRPLEETAEGIAIGEDLLYFGKAKGAIKFRYTKAEVTKWAVEVIPELSKIPNNATALGIEQLLIDLNGGAGTGALANKIPAASKQAYLDTGLQWLETHIPNWQELFKYQ